MNILKYVKTLNIKAEFRKVRARTPYHPASAGATGQVAQYRGEVYPVGAKRLFGALCRGKSRKTSGGLCLEQTRGNGGQAIIIAVLFFLLISITVVLGASSLALRESAIAGDLINSKKSYYLAEAAGEDVVYRISAGMNYSNQEVLVLDGLTATTTISTNIETGELEVSSRGDVLNKIRTIKANLTSGNKANFNYGVQIGDGGLSMSNSAQVTGNVYSNGPVTATNKQTIKGDVVSAGSNGFIDGVHATGTAYANDIMDSEVDGDAYFQTISDTTVGGTLYPDSQDQPKLTMPITDETIQSWEGVASSSQIIKSTDPECSGGEYEISDDISLGPVKIECDVEIKGTGSGITITIMGMIWIEGSLKVTQTTLLRLDNSLGKKSIAIIADDPSDRETGSKIMLYNNTTFEGTSQGGYILIVSMNNSEESGTGNEDAIEILQSTNGDLLAYAPHGEIVMANNNDLKEITAYKIRLENQANVIYEDGLANLLFDAGPAGSFSINSWREVE